MSIVLSILLAAQVASGPVAPASRRPVALPRECDSKQQSDTKESEAIAHRLFPAPVIRYPYGTHVGAEWGFGVTLGVDDSGHVTCFSVKNFVRSNAQGMFEPTKVKLSPARRHAIASIAASGFNPFLRNGKPVATTVVVSIREEELPREHVPLPAGPLDAIKIGLSRSGCYAESCANYSVSISGDGTVRFIGARGQAKGEHEYRVPVEEVRRLVEVLRDSDLWSLRPAYRTTGVEPHTFTLDFEVGGQKHQIVDVSGEYAGMPAAVTTFQDEVDRVGKTDMWNPLSLEGIEQLRQEGFVFTSKAGEDLLSRVFFHGPRNEEVVLRLLELGVPVTSSREFPDGSGGMLTITALQDAASIGMERVVEELVRRGALLKDGKIDQHDLNEAFTKAIRAGRLRSVQAIWNATGETTRPSLMEKEWLPKGSEKMRSVVLRLDHDLDKDIAWQGFEIAEWFSSLGVDLNARSSDGLNLLQIAAQGNDPKLARFLLDHGLDPSAEGQYGRTPLAETTDERVVLMLLEAGADVTKVENEPGEFRGIAEYEGWTKVLAWMTSHDRKE